MEIKELDWELILYRFNNWAFVHTAVTVEDIYKISDWIKLAVEQQGQWFNMNDDNVWRPGDDNGMPPEGIDVMTRNGDNQYIMYYIMSGEYRWINILDDNEQPLPFMPTHWRFLTMDESRKK